MTSTGKSPIYDSSNLRPPFLEEFVQLIAGRDLVLLLVSRNVKTRYKRSFLGVAWTMLHPLMMMTVLAVVFSNVFRISTEHYAVFVLSGLLAWGLFSESTSEGMSSMTLSGNLLGKIYLPKAIYATAAVGTGLVNIAFSVVPLLLIMVLTGVPLTPALLTLPIPVFLLAVFSLGIGLGLSSVAVFVGDLIPLYSVLLRILFYLTPIIYPPDILPQAVRWIVYVNPLYPMLLAFRAPILEGRIAAPEILGAAALWAAVSLFFGWWIFAKRADEYAYRV